MTTESISHHGKVTQCMGEKAIVQLTQHEACHSCHIKEFCGKGDGKVVSFEVSQNDLAVGDQVSLQISPAIGFKALFWAYLFPFLLILMVIVGGSMLAVPEHWLGVTALFVLLPYFIGLSRFKRILKSQLNLQVKKL
ncbi:MAG: SoxR reducing system RseC family protein [Cytophagales bacterium]|nr:SoxR reducing system RseC family protein [Cytophagales bacterium]